jgi:hypothetical protein
MYTPEDSSKLCHRSEEILQLQAELHVAKSTIEELKADKKMQTYEMEEVNVIINLQDDLRASKQVIQHQKFQIENMLSTSFESRGAEIEEPDYKAKFLKLQARYSQLQNDRAWADFQFRDRICKDSLKYHRRLIHWKSKNQQLEKELEEAKARTTRLETKWKSTASSVLQHTLQDLKISQENCKKVEKELTRIKSREKEAEIMTTSSNFLLRAATQSNFLN